MKKSNQTKTSSKTQTPAPTDKPVVVTVTISPLKNGKRPLVISGAPDGEMPVVRSGYFSEIHPLFDEMWLELIKRKPKVVIKPAASKSSDTPKPATGTKADQDGSAEGNEDATGETESAAEASEGTSAEAEAQFEQSILEAKADAETESQETDQLVHPEPEDAAVEPAEPLPLIEGDPTLAQG